MWNVNTTLHLTEKLSSEKYDFILNYGVCGYKHERADYIQIVRSVYFPTGKEILTPVFFQFAPLASILCSEVPIDSAELLWDENYVDMESYAVEKVCEHFRIPRLILKVPIDKIGEETRNFDIPKAIELLETHIVFSLLMKKIETYLSSLPKETNMETYYNHYKFTVSEKILLQKYMQKYESLSDTPFDIFFWEHKNTRKKQFMQELSDTLSQLSQL